MYNMINNTIHKSIKFLKFKFQCFDKKNPIDAFLKKLKIPVITKYSEMRLVT